jgi:predicted 3-demethylubiquinone-9 3-methyltransferase (glyoxalase superfamily)
MDKITPFFWYDNNAEEVANYYVSVFKNSKINTVARYSEEGANAANRPPGSVLTIGFSLEGRSFTALNGGPAFPNLPAISFVISCDNQEEVDYYWEKLSDGGEAGQCGWINHDKYGLTWQVVPKVLIKMLNDKDYKKAERVMSAMLKMTKIEIADLEAAYNES